MFSFRSLVGRLLLITLVTAISCALAHVVHADQSASYQLTTDFPNAATNNAKASTNFQLQEDAMTWHDTHAASTSYELTSPLAANAVAGGGSSSASSVSSAASSSNGSQPSGGCRGEPCVTSSSSSSSAGHSSSNGAASSSTSAPSPSSSSAGSSPGSASSKASSAPTFHGAAPEGMSLTPPTVTGALAQEPGLRYFDVVGPACVQTVCPQIQQSTPAAGSNLFAFALALVVIAILGGVLFLLALYVLLAWLLLLLAASLTQDDDSDADHLPTDPAVDETSFRTEVRRIEKRMTLLRVLFWIVVLFATVAFVLWIRQPASAATTSPLEHIYNGHLLDASGNPVTTSHTIRFSYWKSADFVSTDVTGTGAINTGAPNYVGWQEQQTVTPDSHGYFSVTLGSVTPLPAIDSLPVSTLLSLYLQVEVKAAASPLTSYELLDPNPSDAAIDRSPVLSVPFALNADMIDRHDVGTGSGAIPVLGSGGLITTANAAQGTNQDFFTIDSDNSAGATIGLRFGQALNKTLTYDIANGRFDFSASLKVEGNLTVTGLINGVNINALGSAVDTYLKVSSGAGLTINIGAGSERINGTMTNYAGASGLSVANNTTNYVFLTSTGVTITVGGFTTNKSFLPLAEVVTSGGAVTAITDRRILSSDNREEPVQDVLHPQYKDAALSGSGTTAVGQLIVTQEGSTLRNFYEWTSTRPTLQGYDILVRYRLPPTFLHWNKGLFIDYRSTSASSADNRLDVQVYDTAGSTVTLSGSTLGLASTTWQKTHINFLGSPVWTPGQDIVLRLKLSARNNEQMHLGDLQIDYVKANTSN